MEKKIEPPAPVSSAIRKPLGYQDLFFGVVLPLLGVMMAVYWVWLLGVWPGWTETTEYINYHVQFKQVISALVECSRAGGVFEAQVQGTSTGWNCRTGGIAPVYNTSAWGNITEVVN